MNPQQGALIVRMSVQDGSIAPSNESWEVVNLPISDTHGIVKQLQQLSEEQFMRMLGSNRYHGHHTAISGRQGRRWSCVNRSWCVELGCGSFCYYLWLLLPCYLLLKQLLHLIAENIYNLFEGAVALLLILLLTKLQIWLNQREKNAITKTRLSGTFLK